MLMPFGKHKSTPVAELPKRYLGWLLKNVELRGELKAAVEAAKTGRTYLSPDELVDQLVRPVEKEHNE